MKQLYYTIQTLLRGRGSNVIKVISLTLGLLVGILLFARVAFELNYDSYYSEPENLCITLRTGISDGIKKEPNIDNYGKLAEAIRENFPDEVEDATVLDLFSQSPLYHEGKKMEHVILATSKSHVFSTLGIKVLQMFPNSTEWMLFLSPVHLPGVCLQTQIRSEKQSILKLIIR